MLSEDRYEEIFEHKGISFTRLRRYIIRALIQSDRAITPAEILKKVRVWGPINKVTLYRILDIYESENIVRKVLCTDKAAKYELIDLQNIKKKSIDAYFVCRICRRIKPIKVNWALIEIKLWKRYGSSLDVAVAGICLRCRNKQRFERRSLLHKRRL